MDWDAVRADALRVATNRVAESYEASMRQMSYVDAAAKPRDQDVIRGIETLCREALSKAEEAMRTAYRQDDEIRVLRDRIEKLCEKPEMRTVANQTEKRRVSFENAEDQCQFCLRRIPKLEMSTHSQRCDLAVIQCDKCGDQLRRWSLDQHECEYPFSTKESIIF